MIILVLFLVSLVSSLSYSKCIEAVEKKIGSECKDGKKNSLGKSYGFILTEKACCYLLCKDGDKLFRVQATKQDVASCPIAVPLNEDETEPGSDCGFVGDFVKGGESTWYDPGTWSDDDDFDDWEIDYDDDFDDDDFEMDDDE